MDNPRDAALHFEAVKVSMRQDSKGSYITLVIHPDQTPVDLFKAHPGSRFMVAMVALNDDDTPVKNKETTEAERAVQSAGMLCRNIQFQRWLNQNGLTLGISEDDAIAGLKYVCQIESRAELKTNPEALHRFQDLRQRFEDSIKR